MRSREGSHVGLTTDQTDACVQMIQLLIWTDPNTRTSSLSHKLRYILGWPNSLSKGEKPAKRGTRESADLKACYPMSRSDTPLHALNVLARHLVVQHVCDRVDSDLLPRRTLVNADHSDTDRPGGIADTQAQVGVVCFLVLAVLHVMYDFGQQAEDVWFEVLRV